MYPQIIDLFPLGLTTTVSPFPPHQLLLHHHNHHILLLPQPPRLFFLPCSHCYYIHGHVYPPPRQYHHLWLSWLSTHPWQHIMLTMTLGCCHPHRNRLLHSRCRPHHYGGSVDNLSGCQNVLSTPALPRWCSLGSIQKLARFSSAAVYPPYLSLRPWK